MNATQPTSNRDWVEQELGEVRLGDARLDRRLLETAARMADRPTATNSQRLDWNELRGLYRIAHAPRAQLHLLQENHRLRTRQRMEACPGRVLIVHDTTELDFTSHTAAHHFLGPIGTGGGFGFLQHNSLAFDPDGKQILGLAFQQLVERRASNRTARPATSVPVAPTRNPACGSRAFAGSASRRRWHAGSTSAIAAAISSRPCNSWRISVRSS